MKTTLINELSQPAMDTYLATRQYNELFWPNFFPVKQVPTLDAKTIIGASGNRTAAYIISYDAKAPEISRKSLSTKHFDIPKIAVAIRKTEKEILEHQILRSTLGSNAVIENYFADLDGVYDGVQARMEWFAATALSTGSVTLSTSNNALGIINETAISFGIPTANKEVVTTDTWSTTNANTMLPITDFKKVMAEGRKIGVKLQYAVMNQDMFDIVTGSTEYLNAMRALVGITSSDLLGMQSLEMANKLMTNFGLPKIVIYDTYVNIENAAGTRTATNPWSTTHVTFLPDLVCGSYMTGPIAEELEKPVDILQSKRGPVLLSVRKEFNPSAVLTKAECNAFPSWSNIDQCFSLYTNSTSTWA
jgi:hypothetical protein